MKLFILSLVVLLAVVAFADDDDNDWQAFKVKFGKMFLSKGKEEKRRAAFKKNKAVLDDLQAKADAGHITFEPAIYAFHDLEPEEMLARMTGLEEGEFNEATAAKQPALRQTFATNYSTVNVLGAVRDQKSCGSCWTFSTINAIEAGYTKKTGAFVDLSEQYLVDCSKRDSSNNPMDGCQGGWMPTAFNWLAKNGGTVEESLYPYTAIFGSCVMGKTKKVAVSGYVTIANDTTSIKNAIMTYGSLAIAVDASQWSYYGKGVFTATKVGGINHAVNLVGWGYDSYLKQNYWLIRNSWGTGWGEKGYIRVATTTLGTYYPQYTFAVKLA